MFVPINQVLLGHSHAHVAWLFSCLKGRVEEPQGPHSLRSLIVCCLRLSGKSVPNPDFRVGEMTLSCVPLVYHPTWKFCPLCSDVWDRAGTHQRGRDLSSSDSGPTMGAGHTSMLCNFSDFFTFVLRQGPG